LLLITAGKLDPVCKTLDKVRQFVAEQLGEIPAGKHNLLWVTDFPMFGWNEEEQRLEVRACRLLSTAHFSLVSHRRPCTTRSQHQTLTTCGAVT
jgi:aspartyl-tRNA synthetase